MLEIQEKHFSPNTPEHILIDHIIDFGKYGLDLLEHLNQAGVVKNVDPDTLHAYIEALKVVINTGGLILSAQSK